MAELTFEEEQHKYKLDGITIPSVTQILKDSGLIDLSFVDKELLEQKADIGHKAHATTELYDKNDLNIEALHPLLKSYLDAWIKFRNECEFIPTLIEGKYFHPLYRYAGRIDRVGTLQKDLTQLDIKSGVPHRAYAIQSAAYTELYNDGKPKKDQVKRRFTLYLKEDGTYSLQEHKSKNDIRVFLAALTITNYKRNGK